MLDGPLFLLLLLFPEHWYFLFLAFADHALVIIAESLLGPERALTFKVDFVCPEVRGCL
jgi:hypothetical protein